MTTLRRPHRAVVVLYDGSVSGRRALDWAIQHISRTHAPLVLVHAIGTLGAAGTAWLTQSTADDPFAVLEGMRADGQRILDQAAARVADALPHASVRTIVRALDPREALMEFQDAAVIVVGSRGRGPIRSFLLGSVSAAVSRHACCPVVVVRPSQRGLVRRGVLVGADGTAHSLPAVEFAYQYASLHDLPLTVMHSTWDLVADADGLDPDEARLLLSESVSGLGAKYPDVYVTLEVSSELPDHCLVRAGERMDLVVVGRRAPRNRPRVGVIDICLSVVEHARCAVAVVPDTESRSFVTIGLREHDERL